MQRAPPKQKQPPAKPTPPAQGQGNALPPRQQGGAPAKPAPNDGAATRPDGQQPGIPAKPVVNGGNANNAINNNSLNSNNNNAAPQQPSNAAAAGPAVPAGLQPADPPRQPVVPPGYGGWRWVNVMSGAMELGPQAVEPAVDVRNFKPVEPSAYSTLATCTITDKTLYMNPAVPGTSRWDFLVPGPHAQFAFTFLNLDGSVERHLNPTVGRVRSNLHSPFTKEFNSNQDAQLFGFTPDLQRQPSEFAQVAPCINLANDGRPQDLVYVNARFAGRPGSLRWRLWHLRRMDGVNPLGDQVRARNELNAALARIKENEGRLREYNEQHKMNQRNDEGSRAVAGMLGRETGRYFGRDDEVPPELRRQPVRPAAPARPNPANANRNNIVPARPQPAPSGRVLAEGEYETDPPSDSHNDINNNNNAAGRATGAANRDWYGAGGDGGGGDPTYEQ